MRLITRETMARDAVESLKPRGEKKAAALAALVAKGGQPDPDEIDRIFGAKHTQVPLCTECKVRAPVVVQVGYDETYAQEFTYICGQCLLKALQLIDGD